LSEIAVLTRRPEDNAPLAADLRARGVAVIELPCVRTELLADTHELESEVTSLGLSDLLVLTSRAGVDAVAQLGRPVACDVAVVGPATAEAARRAGLAVAFVAAHAGAATLARGLPLPTGLVLLARSDLADDELPRLLRARGARVREVVAYRTVAGITEETGPARDAIARGASVVVASPSAVRALVDGLGRSTLRRARFVAIGERTGRALRERVDVEPVIAADTDERALLDAVIGGLQEVGT
jgi:uroporphyrinogen-III synthase